MLSLKSDSNGFWGWISVFCGRFDTTRRASPRAQAHSSPLYVQKSFAHHPKIAQREQYRQPCLVLGQTPVGTSVWTSVCSVREHSFTIALVDPSPVIFSQLVRDMYTLILTNLVAQEVSEDLIIDDLWKLDLLEHTRYLTPLRIVGRCITTISSVKDSTIARKSPLGCEWGADFFWLDGWRSGKEFVEKFVKNLFVLRSIIKDASIVHTGINGWPIPEGWYIIPLAILYKKRIIVILESGNWNVPIFTFRHIKKYLGAKISRSITRFLLNRCAFVVSTNQGYFEQLKLAESLPKVVIPASWIAEDNIISEEDLSQQLANKPHAHFAFFGRLTSDKGIYVLIDALKYLAKSRIKLSIDFYGAGECEREIKQLADDLANTSVRIVLKGLIPYDHTFFKRIEQYTAILVPSKSPEQPRIIYDAFARGMLVIASDTPGNLEVVKQGKNGILFPSKNSTGLADSIRSLLLDEVGEKIDVIRKAARDTALKHTHREMHQKRFDLIKKYFDFPD